MDGVGCGIVVAGRGRRVIGGGMKDRCSWGAGRGIRLGDGKDGVGCDICGMCMDMLALY